MRLERTKNAKRNILFGSINKSITLFLPFLIRAALINTIGVQYAGLNTLFSSVLQVLNLTELGFSSAVVYSMYKPIVEDDEDKICALLNFYRKVYFVIGLVVLSIGVLLTPAIPYLINGREYPADVNLYGLYFLYLLNSSISYLFFGYKNALLSAHQRADVISNITTLTQGMMYGLQLVVLFFVQNYYLYIIMMPFFTMVNNLLVSCVVRKKYPQYVCRGRIDNETVREIKIKVAGLLVNKLCYTSRNTFDSIFISAYLGLTTAAIYGNYYTVIVALGGMISVVTTAMLAGVGNSIQTENTEKNYSSFKRFNFMYMCLSGWSTICLMCLFQPFICWWLGKEYLLSDSAMVLLCVYFYVLRMGDIRGVYSDAAGLWWENRHRAIVEAIANLILNFVLVQVAQIHGIIVATLVTLIIINFFYGSQLVFKHYFKNGKAKEYFVLHGKYILVSSFVAVVTGTVCSIIVVESLFWQLIVRGIICLLMPPVLYYVAYCRTKEFQDACYWIKTNLLKY